MTTPLAGQWEPVGNLRGPQGDKGDPGDPGADGGTTPHATRHATGGTDPLSPAQIGATPTTRQVTAGTGLTGGGTLAADRTLAVVYGTSAGTAAQGNDSRLSDARPPTAHNHAAGDITSGTMAAARLPVGAAAGTVAAGNDARLSDARTPTAHTHSGADITVGTVPAARLPVGSSSGTVAAGDHTHTPASIGAAPASHRHSTGDLDKVIPAQTTVANNGTATPNQADDVDRFNTTGANATLAVPSGTPVDGNVVNVEVYSTGSATNLVLAGGYVLTGGQTSPVAVPSGKVAHLALRYRGAVPAGWRILAVSVDN